MTRPKRLMVGLAGICLGFATLVISSSPALASGTPYTDPAVTGALGLCDKSGHQVVSGSTQDIPLAWTVVSTTPAPAGYTDSRAKATLYMYQPRKDVDPGDWSGYPMTGSSLFSSPAHPMAAFTTGDKRLFDTLQVYPAQWNGYVELRLFFSGTNRVALTQTYPAANLQINGTLWRQVAPPVVSCTAGKAESTETLLLPASSFPTPSRATPSPATTGPSSGAAASASPAGGFAAGGPAQPSAQSSGTSTSGSVLTGLLLVAVVGLGIGLVVVLRQRRAVP